MIQMEGKLQTPLDIDVFSTEHKLQMLHSDRASRGIKSTKVNSSKCIWHPNV